MRLALLCFTLAGILFVAALGLAVPLAALIAGW